MDKVREKVTKQILSNLQQDKELAKFQELVKNNKIEFKIKDKTYRVRKMLLSEKEELLEQKAVKFGELLSKPNWKFREQIIEECRNKGYGLDKIDKEISRILAEIENISEKLGKTGDTHQREPLEKEITTLEYEQALIYNKKTQLFQYSIEDYLEFYVKSYLGYLVTEVKANNKWERVFKNYKEFSDSDNYDLTVHVAEYVNYLINLGELN